jgi:bacteriochlorophyllide a dehydrogenase
MKTQAVLFTAVNTVALGDVEVPDPEVGEVFLRAAFTGISPGTEKRCLAGLQEGAPAFPFVPGYSFTGTVEKVGAGVEVPIGARVLCSGTARVLGANRLWGGHIGHAVRAAADVHLVPDGVSLKAASLARLAAIAYHGVQLAAPRAHERVVVVGLGPVGLLSARLFALSGCKVVGVDPLKSRQSYLETAVSSIDEARQLLETGADIVVDATGAPGVLPQAISLARDLPWGDHNERGARVVIQGSYPKDFSLPYNDAFLKEAVLYFPRDNQPRDVKAILDLLSRKKLIVEDLITDIFLPLQASDAYARLNDSENPPVTACFDWETTS